MPDLLIRGAALVTPSGLQSADLAVDGESISAIAPNLPSAPHEIDASGLTHLTQEQHLHA